jgi:hypothetical protein
MAARTNNTEIRLPYAFCNDLYLFRPEQLRAYFQQNKTLQVPANHTLYFWMNEQISSEWTKNTPSNVEKVVKVFNEYLNPVGKACAFVAMFDENIQVEALDDGFKLSTSEYGFRVMLV